MSKQNQEFANNLLSKVHYIPDNDDWIKGATSTVLSKEEAIWIKSNNRLHRIESIIRRITDIYKKEKEKKSEKISSLSDLCA